MLRLPQVVRCAVLMVVCRWLLGTVTHCRAALIEVRFRSPEMSSGLCAVVQAAAVHSRCRSRVAYLLLSSAERCWLTQSDLMRSSYWLGK